MRLALALLVPALIAAGCGGDDDDATTTPETAASGTGEVVEGTPYDITVGEFIVELQPDKQAILKAFVADSDACEGVKVDPSFVLLVSAQAIDADQDAPLADLIEDQC